MPDPAAADDRVRIIYQEAAYPIVVGDCACCKQWWFYVDLPEFAFAYCPYCGLKFRGYVNGETGRDHRLNGRPMGEG